jgi:hypothetical protein
MIDRSEVPLLGGRSATDIAAEISELAGWSSDRGQPV